MRSRAGKDRHLETTIVVGPLHMPIAGGLAILEQVRWFTGVAHANANAGRASSAASSVAVPHVVIGRVVRTRAARQRQHSDQQQDKAQRHWKIRAPFSPPSGSIVIVPARSSGERVAAIYGLEYPHRAGSDPRDFRDPRCTAAQVGPDDWPPSQSASSR